jgi:hypothetical protein
MEDQSHVGLTARRSPKSRPFFLDSAPQPVNLMVLEH